MTKGVGSSSGAMQNGCCLGGTGGAFLAAFRKLRRCSVVRIEFSGLFRASEWSILLQEGLNWNSSGQLQARIGRFGPITTEV